MAKISLWLTALVSLFTKQEQAPAEDISTYHTPFASPNFQPHEPSPKVFVPQQSGMAKKPQSRIIPPRKEKAAVCHVAISMPNEESQVRSLSTHRKSSISAISKGLSINTPIQEENKSRYQVVIDTIVRNLQEKELGKVVLLCAIPLTGLLITPYANSISSPVLQIIVSSLCGGFVCLWNSLLLRGAIPDIWASRLEILGVVCMMIAFFSVVGSFLPPDIVWIVGVCFLLCVLPLALSFCHVKETTLASGNISI